MRSALEGGEDPQQMPRAPSAATSRSTSIRPSVRAAVGQPAAAPAEHDPPVARGAEVVDERAAVGDALAARPADPLDHVGHRLGEHDVRGGHRQPRPQRAARPRARGRPPARRRLREHALRRFPPPPRPRARHSRPAPGTARRARTRECSKISTPRSISRPPQAERQPRRLHASRSRASARRAGSAGDVAARLHLAPRTGRHRSGAPSARGRLDRSRPASSKAGAGRDAQVAGLVEPGVHVVVLAPRADRGHRLARRVEQRARRLVAEALAQRGRAQPERLAESAVAPARAVAADLALQQGPRWPGSASSSCQPSTCPCSRLRPPPRRRSGRPRAPGADRRSPASSSHHPVEV